MSFKVPPVGQSLLDLLKVQMPFPTAAKRDGAAPARGAPLAWEKMPPAILRILAEATSGGFPLEALLPSTGSTGYAAYGPGPHAPGVSPSFRPDSPGDRLAAQIGIVARLFTAADQGTISVDELNRFLALVSLEGGTLRNATALLSAGGEALNVNGSLYRLVEGRIVPYRRPRPQPPAQEGEAPKLWIETAIVLAVAALIVAALMRFS